jgi:sigma-B regulation protein RsbU (phosphoserine phosphatase)
MMPSMEYETIELELELGDRLCLYSDGITECTGRRLDQFGEHRLRRWLGENSSQPLSQALKTLEAQLEEWKGGEDYQDDVSVLAMEIVDGEE